MIRELSTKNRVTNLEIDRIIGKPYPFFQRLKLGGITSPRFDLISTSKRIAGKLKYKSLSLKCKIELRPRGIIVLFLFSDEVYGWIIPYWRLNIVKTYNNVSVYAQEDFIKFALQNKKKQQRFIRKLIYFKAWSVECQSMN
jgi:hypothetical protein